MPGSESFPPGREFETMVWEVLELLQKAHSKVVTIKSHPRLKMHTGIVFIPDFELSYRLPHKTDHQLIECQDRTKSSHDIVNKIKEMRASSDRNRFIFVYPDRKALTEAVREHLASAGILHYEFSEFIAMLAKLSQTLERTESITLARTDELRREFGFALTKAVFADSDDNVLGLFRAAFISYFQRLWHNDPSYHPDREMNEGAEENTKPPVVRGTPKSVQFMAGVVRFARKKRRLGLKFCEEVRSQLANFVAREDRGQPSRVTA